MHPRWHRAMRRISLRLDCFRGRPRCNMRVMDVPPPLPPGYTDRRKTDAEHLSLLSIFHYVVAGFVVIVFIFLSIHFGFMNAMLSNPEIWKNSGPNSTPPPPQLWGMFKAFYAFAAFVLVLAGVGNVLSGIFIHRRKNRMFSLVIAGLNCLQMPFGTILGVFTIIVLVRPSVRDMYDAQRVQA
jgi:hypothetical protein